MDALRYARMPECPKKALYRAYYTVRNRIVWWFDLRRCRLRQTEAYTKWIAEHGHLVLEQSTPSISIEALGFTIGWNPQFRIFFIGTIWPRTILGKSRWFEVGPLLYNFNSEDENNYTGGAK